MNIQIIGFLILNYSKAISEELDFGTLVSTLYPNDLSQIQV